METESHLGLIASSILIAAPFAFIAGWLLAKAMFRHLSVTRPHARHGAPPPDRRRPVHGDAKLPAGEERRGRVQAELRARLEQSQEDNDALSNEIALLKDSLAEERLRVSELERDVAEANASAERAAAKFDTWRQRLKPLAQQYRQQRVVITELREELRRNQADAPELEATEPTETASA